MHLFRKKDYEDSLELIKKVEASDISKECTRPLRLAEKLQYYAIYKDGNDFQELDNNSDDTDSCFLHAMTHEHTEVLGEFCDCIVPSP